MDALPPKALVCVDFDGTLVDSGRDPSFPDELGERLIELQRAGVAWSICTGRALFQVVEGLTQHGIRARPDFVISGERELYRRTQHSRWIEVGKWNTRSAKAHRKLFKGQARFFKRIKVHIETTTEARFLGNGREPVGIAAVSDEEMDRICGYLNEQMPNVPGFAYERNSIYLRFSHREFSKGTTVGELARVLGLTPERIVTMGDNHNDLSMLDLRIARRIGCPSNSVEAVKAIVSRSGGFVAQRPAGWGVLDALNHFFGS